MDSNQAPAPTDGNSINPLPVTPPTTIPGTATGMPNDQFHGHGHTHTPRTTRTPEMLRPLRASTPTPRRDTGGGDDEDDISDISSLSPVSSTNPSVLVFSDDSDYSLPIRDVMIIPNEISSIRPRTNATLQQQLPRPRANLNLEFEIASYDDEVSENPIEDPDSSSDADSINSFIPLEIANLDSKRKLKSDEVTDSEASSEASSINSNGQKDFLTDSEIDEKDHWFCTQCKVETNKPYLRYCLRCFRIRREWLPKRPKPSRKHPNQNITEEDKDSQGYQNLNLAFVQSQSISMASLSQDSKSVDIDEMEIETNLLIPTPKPSELSNISNPRAATTTSNTCISIGETSNPNPLQTSTASANSSSLLKTKYPESNFLEDALDAPPLKVAKLSGTSKSSSSDGVESLCSICMVRERNAAFVHGKSAHMCTCYPCGDKILKKSGKCPICRKRILRVVKIIVA